VNLRPGATSTTGGPWLCLGTRKDRCCRRDWTTPFEGGGGEPVSNWMHTQSCNPSLVYESDTDLIESSCGLS
jgi:hypothetical protein